MNDSTNIRLPPIGSLLAFDAVARHLSIRKAADELNLTASAVSHRIQVLEQHLDIELLTRTTRSVALTPSGEAYLKHASKAIRELETARSSAAVKALQRTVTLATTDSYASLRLIGVIEALKEVFPEIALRVVTESANRPLDLRMCDLAIVHTPIIAADTSNMRLLHKDEIIPVCSAKMAVKDGADFRPIISGLPLIHDENLGVSWVEFVRATSLNVSGDLSEGLRFNHSHLALKAAMNSSGVTLASKPLVQPFLDAGSIISPCNASLDLGRGYFLLASDYGQDQLLRQFADAFSNLIAVDR